MKLNKNQLYAGFEYASDCKEKINYINIILGSEENIANLTKSNNYHYDDITKINKKINNSYYKIITNGEEKN